MTPDDLIIGLLYATFGLLVFVAAGLIAEVVLPWLDRRHEQARCRDHLARLDALQAHLVRPTLPPTSVGVGPAAGRTRLRPAATFCEHDGPLAGNARSSVPVRLASGRVPSRPDATPPGSGGVA